jgi:hypothetical protein
MGWLECFTDFLMLHTNKLNRLLPVMGVMISSAVDRVVALVVVVVGVVALIVVVVVVGVVTLVVVVVALVVVVVVFGVVALVLVVVVVGIWVVVGIVVVSSNDI